MPPSGIRDNLNAMVSLVDSNLDDLKHFWDDNEEISTAPLDQSISSAFDMERVDKKAGGNRVFVIHGCDEAIRETVARFLEKLDLEPIILHEQPNKGCRIIEKFEDHTVVDFAVVLLTPDALGALAANGDDLKPRARQNVILKLGFFSETRSGTGLFPCQRRGGNAIGL